MTTIIKSTCVTLLATLSLSASEDGSTLNVSQLQGATQFTGGLYFEGRMSDTASREPAISVTLLDSGMRVTTEYNTYEITESKLQSEDYALNFEFGNYKAPEGRLARFSIFDRFEEWSGTTGTAVSEFYQDGQTIDYYSLEKRGKVSTNRGIKPGSNWVIYKGVDVTNGGPYEFLQELTWTDNGRSNILDEGDVFTFGNTYYVESKSPDYYTFDGYKVDIPEPAHMGLLSGMLSIAIAYRRRR